jgi:opacity protein-like surface antigen
MKSVIFLNALALFFLISNCCLAAEGQSRRAARHASGGENVLGLEFGPQFATGSVGVDQGSLPDTSSRTLMNVSAFFEHALDRNFSLRPEFGFSERGFSVHGSDGSADFGANYFELPLLVKASLPLSGFSPYVLTGPYLGILASKSATETANDGRRTNVSLNDKVNSFEFGWDFGLGSSIDLARGMKLDVGFRYSAGIANASAVDGSSIKLSAFQFLTGVSASI